MLLPSHGGIYLDATFGAGGYTKALLEQVDCFVVAVDRDEYVKSIALDLSKSYPDRFKFLHGKFSDIDDLLRENDIHAINGILFDIGVSSMQLDQAERGFSFMKDGKLDMRMGYDKSFSAFDIVNNYSKADLEHIIREYGGEKKAKIITNAIVSERNKEPINNTMQLAKIISSIVGKYNDDIHPATRTFQAIRMEVNDEL